LKFEAAFRSSSKLNDLFACVCVADDVPSRQQVVAGRLRTHTHPVATKHSRGVMASHSTQEQNESCDEQKVDRQDEEVLTAVGEEIAIILTASSGTSDEK
jgi:hypothetical protein